MKISAVICEYNPFHNGHKYQIEQIKKENDAVICIMSGDFVQRGDVAVFDKHERTKAALLSGADLVIMLPACFSLNTAERFAYGGVSLCESLGVVDNICFGSECGDIKKLTLAADLLINEPYEVSKKIKELLDGGMSYPKARMEAFSGLIDGELLTEPNNILAIEYIKALKNISSKIKPSTIKRYKAGYHDENPSDEFASASAVRDMIFSKEEYLKYIPKNVYEIYSGESTSDIQELDDILMYKIRTTSPEEIAKINDVTEGLENRIKSSLQGCYGFDEVVEFVKTKRYTQTKIRRILLSLILGIDKQLSLNAPEYIRVLGMNKKGKEILSKIKKKSSLPIITKTADYKGFNTSFDIDILAGDIFTICSKNPKFGCDFQKSPVVVE